MTDTQKQPASVPLDLVKQWLDEWGNSDCLSVLQFIANRACDYGREQAQWVPAVHAAERTDLHAQIGDLLAISATAKEQGRREALQGLPVDALIYATLLLRLEAGNIESVVSSKTVSTYNRQISKLIESVRAAQQEKTK